MPILNSKVYRKEYNELINLLDEWDFLQVANKGVKEEYRDLVEPILSELQKHKTMKDLIDKVNESVYQRYGLKINNNETEKFVQKVMDWWGNKYH